jgi:hypothetical protein
MGQRGEALHLSRESFILGSLHSFNFFLWWANQIGSLQNQKKKVGLVRHPQLINMKQNNKYPKFMGVTFEYSVHVQLEVESTFEYK